MSKCLNIIAFGGLFLVSVGCDTEQRISRLEKQTQELTAQISKDHATADYDLQAKCSRDAREWFKENSSSDKNTITLTYINHYNHSLNKCFVLVENHYNSNLGGDSSWTNYMTLWDVYENSQYGSFGENHVTYLKPTVQIADEVIMCEVFSKKCKTVEEYNGLVRPYLSN